MSSIPIEFVIPILIFGAKGAGFVIKHVKNRQRLRGWQDAAGACGLQILETSNWSSRLTARAGPVAVTTEPNGSSARIDVRIAGSTDFYHVRICRESRVRRAGEIEIGDHSFDTKFSIDGPPRQVLAMLDAETRRLLICANAESWLELSIGTLRADHTDDEKVPYVLSLLLDIGRRFMEVMDVPRRLADNARRDPEAGVRLQNLRLLIRELPEAPETLEALRVARSDPSPWVRLLAAKGLGAEGRDLLLDLAESLVNDAVSADAVSTLDRELSIERTKAILDHALDRSSPKTARACLEALGRSGDAAADEAALLKALQHEETDLRMTAANALGRVGSVTAVLPLQEAAESSRDHELRRAARQAIAEIQSRLHGASPGQLSVADAGGGQLSLASSEVGQVSLAVEPFPLPPEEPEQSSSKADEGPAERPV